MTATSPIHVTSATFEEVALKSTVPVILDFWAPWCGPCKTVAMLLDKYAKDYAGKLIVVKINTDEEGSLAEMYNVQGLPTLALLVDGKEIQRAAGSTSGVALGPWLQWILK
jgi:thioredoxin 1